MSIFKAYDIRGVVPGELDEPMALAIGRAFGGFLASEVGARRKPLTVAVGHDMRTSSPGLAREVAKGLVQTGADIVHIGRASTPMLNFAVAHWGLDGGVAVTASHNPAQYNGFKLCRREGIPLSGTTGLADLERWVKTENERFKPARRRGTLRRKAIFGAYKRFLARLVRPGKRKLKIIADCGNGMTGPFEFKILKERFGSIKGMYLKPDGRFPNHEANPIIEENVADLAAAVRKARADCGVAFDGDGDRVVFVDERGESVAGDKMLALLAGHMLAGAPGAAVLYDLRSSWAVKEEIARAGGESFKSRVGHAFIKAQLREHEGLMAGELSGHYYFKEFFYLDSGGVAALRALEILSKEDRPLSALIAPFGRYPKTPEINFRVEDARSVLSRLESAYKSKGAIEHLDGLSFETADFWFNVRMSNTEPLVRLNMEAREKDMLDRECERVVALIGGRKV